MENLMTASLKRFNYLTSEIEATYHEAALKLGLSDSALTILYTLCNYKGSCPLADIQRLSGISKQTLNSAIRKLETECIVYLETFQGKKKRAYLTDKGKELTENTVARLIEIENAIFASWTKAEQELYLELTQRYLDAFRDKLADLTKGGDTQ
ncbi:MAG: MarR family transcriptional regulator [Lachnospiraceae bacterium]|nr:MarR family transcriptional regulator [Lachnospiraceae bacterium]